MVIREDILNILHVKKHYSVVSRRIASYLSKKISVWGFFQLACASSPWVISEKKTNRKGMRVGGGGEMGGGGLRTWNFQEHWRKKMRKFLGSIKKEVEFPGVFEEKLMWNFHGSWFLILEFPRGVTQFCWISRGESLFSPEFLRVKSQI